MYQWSQHISHSLKPFNKCFRKIWFVNIDFLYKVLFMIKYISIFRWVLRCLLVARKENSTGFSTGLTGQSKNLDPTGRSTRPVSISALNDSFANECGVLKLLDVINHCFGSSYENTDASLFLTKSPLQAVSTNFLSNLF